ncbi:MAG: hypothetical protein IBX55_15170, partial [Methyloprofundus sp.]|nr:hypothetical protein [Methyloprofundus sp.]
LTQMESFEGIFIASTNLMNDLDQAAMRRFDLKLEFKPMTKEQAWSLFKNMLKEHGVALTNQSNIKQRLGALTDLTPGDFAVVARKFYISMEVQNTTKFLKSLEEEVRNKPLKKYSRPIGFVV